MEIVNVTTSIWAFYLSVFKGIGTVSNITSVYVTCNMFVYI